jgi:hypothetical protein
MRKLATSFITIFFLLSLFAGGAQATTRTFGTGGTYATFTTALTAASSGDTLTQVGASSEALASAYTCSNKALVIVGATNLTTTVTAYKVTFSGTGTLTMTNLRLTAAVYVNKSSLAFNATGCTFKHPGSGTEVAVAGWGIGFDANPLAMTNCTLDSCTTSTGDLGEIYFFSGTSLAADQTFSNCTINTCDQIGWAAYPSGKIMFSGCTFTGGSVDNGPLLSFTASCDVDSISFQTCTFQADSATYSDINFNDARLVRINSCTIRYWALASAGKSCLFYFADATTAARPKTVWFTNNTITLSKTKPVASGAAMIYAVDKDAGPTWHITGNTFNVVNATEIDYFIYAYSYGSDCTISSNSLYATNIAFIANTAADTLAASLGSRWTFDSNVIDHTNWSPTSGVSAMLTLCPDSVTLTNNRIISNGTSHIVIHNDDTPAASWRAADNAHGASHVEAHDNYFEQLATSSIHYGIVDKGRANHYYNNTFIDHGSTGDVSRVYFAVGDSCEFYNNDVTVTDAGTSYVLDDGAWEGVQAKGNRFHNNTVRGAADYVFMSSSGNGSGWSEGNNCWALRYLTRFDFDGDSMAATSFTDSTSWNMKWGGKVGLTGMTNSAFGTIGVGVSPADYGVPTIGMRYANIPGPWWVLYNVTNNSWPASQDSTEDKNDWYQIMKPVNSTDMAQFKIWMDEYYKLAKASQKALWKVEGVSSGMAAYYGHYRWLDSLASHGGTVADSLDDATWHPIPKPLNPSDELQLYIFRKAYFQLPWATRKKMFWKVLAQSTNFKDWDGYYAFLDGIPGTYDASDEYDPETWFHVPKLRNRSDEEMWAYYSEDYMLLPDATRDKMYFEINQ